ncbi:MAG: WxcM-like domain-containing protein [Lutispora sp.]|nr:WxcM-like domain-containing protein [Lutispora sp.]MDD4834066.1 WxcM-like domain-containing protein [Lutispora sp.]
MEDVELVRIEPFEDARGYLKKTFKKSFFDTNRQIEEIYILYSCKGSVRGNHYHKKNMESFFIIKGTAKVAIKNVKTGFSQEFDINESDNLLMIVPPYVAHAFKNEKDIELIILAIATKEYVQIDNDTYKLVIYE